VTCVSPSLNCLSLNGMRVAILCVCHQNKVMIFDGKRGISLTT